MHRLRLEQVRVGAISCPYLRVVDCPGNSWYGICDIKLAPAESQGFAKGYTYMNQAIHCRLDSEEKSTPLCCWAEGGFVTIPAITQGLPRVPPIGILSDGSLGVKHGGLLLEGLMRCLCGES